MEHHLAFLKKTRTVCGLMEVSKLRTKNMFFIIIYRIYAFLAMSIYLCNLILLLIEIMIKADDPQVMGETLSYSTLYIIMYISLLYIESKDTRIIFDTIDKEERENEDVNSSIKSIYNKYSHINNISGLQITTVCFVFCCIFVVHHMGVLEGKKGFLFYQWFPFDPLSYYWPIVINQIIHLAVVLSYMMYTKLSVISITTFILAKIKILQHCIIYFEHYSNHIAITEEVDIDEARLIVLKNCVIHHNNLIKYLNLVRKHTRAFIMLDFGLTSLQLSAILISLTLMDNRLIDKFVLLYYFVLNIHWMFVTYYYGNELIVQSMKISVLICNKLHWYKYNKRVNDGLLLIMARAQIPLYLSVGPLTELSLSAFLTIIRATFSYLTFMKTIYQK